MRTRLMPLVVPAVAALVLAGLAGPARAERSVVTDARGDVVTYSGVRPARGADGESSADLVTATLVHSARRIRLVARVRDLRPEGRGALPNAVFYLEASGGSGAYMVRRTAAVGGRARAELIDLVSNERLDCRVATRRSPATDRIVHALDRACLDDPRWLKFGAYTVNSSEDHRFKLTDDARREVTTGDGHAVVGGPPAYAGPDPRPR